MLISLSRITRTLRAKARIARDGVSDESPETKAAAEAAEVAASEALKTGFAPEVQEKVNTILAKEKRKAQDSIQKVIKQLEDTQKSAGLTAAEKDALATQIENLKVETMTKEQQAAQKLQDAKKKAAEDLKAASTERDKYKNLFERNLIRNAILDHSAPKAYNPEQFIPVLEPAARVVEEVDDQNRPTGVYNVKFRMTGMVDGKPQPIDLGPSEAVNHLEKDTGWSNLFKSGQVAGTGFNPAAATGSIAKSLKGISSADYMANRHLYNGQGKK